MLDVDNIAFILTFILRVLVIFLGQLDVRVHLLSECNWSMPLGYVF